MRDELFSQPNSIAEFALSQGIPVVKHKGEYAIRVSDETFKYLSSHHEPIIVPLLCSCLQRPYPHELSVHRKTCESPGVYSDYYDSRIRFSSDGMRWPWSLRFAPEMEA